MGGAGDSPADHLAGVVARDDCRQTLSAILFPIEKRLPTERETERVAYALSLYSPLPAGEAKVPPQPLGRPSPTIADPTPRQDTNPQTPPRRVRSKPRLFVTPWAGKSFATGSRARPRSGLQSSPLPLPGSPSFATLSISTTKSTRKPARATR